MRRFLKLSSILCNAREDNIHVTFDARDGGMVDDFLHNPLKINFIPDCVVLKIGENDLEQMRPMDIVAKMMKLALMYVDMGVKHVIICNLVKRYKPRHISKRTFSRRSGIINQELSRILQKYNNIVQFFSFSPWKPKYMHKDGVHLTHVASTYLLKRILTRVRRRINIINT